jgi:hypothetical protein
LTTMMRLAFVVPASALILIVAAAQGPPPGGFGDGPGFGPPGGGGRMRHEQVVTGAPYSGTISEQRQQTLPDGNQITRQTETKVYRDSQGRVRRETTRTNGSGETQTFVTIFDPVAGFEARLNTRKLTAEKHPVPTGNNGAEGSRRPPADGNGPDVKTEDLGTNTIQGMEATGKRVTMTIAAGDMGNADAVQIVRETWTSTALKVPIQMTSTNPRFGKSTMQLTGISQAEPDPALFQIPANYKVITRTGPHGPPPGE